MYNTYTIDMLEVSLSAKHNTKTTSNVGVLELVSNTQGIISTNFRKWGHTEKQWEGWDYSAQIVHDYAKYQPNFWLVVLRTHLVMRKIVL